MGNPMPVLPVSDPADPRVAAYTSIREKDLTSGHGGRFIVEGKVTLETLLTRSRFAVESLFLAESRLEPLADLLSKVPADVPVYTAPQDVMDQVAGFPMHRGVLACGLKGSIPLPGEFVAQDEPRSGPLLLLSDLHAVPVLPLFSGRQTAANRSGDQGGLSSGFQKVGITQSTHIRGVQA